MWLPLWFVPLAALAIFAGRTHVLTQVGVFFSKMAVVTFGGAYAVLAYVAQQAVQNYHWLTASQMLDGMGLAESTPGPLIMVVQFVGFLAGYQSPDVSNPLLMGILAACSPCGSRSCPAFSGFSSVRRTSSACARTGLERSARGDHRRGGRASSRTLRSGSRYTRCSAGWRSTSIADLVRVDVPMLSTINWALLALDRARLHHDVRAEVAHGTHARDLRTAGHRLRAVRSRRPKRRLKPRRSVVDARISLGNVAGRIDHLAYDPTRQRLYVAELGNDSIGIVDLGAETPAAHGPRASASRRALRMSLRRIRSTWPTEAKARFASCARRTSRRSPRFASAPIPTTCGSTSRRSACTWGTASDSGALAIIDPATHQKVADIPLKKHPESFQLEHGDRIFVNVPEANEIAVVSRASRSQVTSWPTGSTGRPNFPLTLDETTGRAIAIFRHPARVAAFDVNTGKVSRDARRMHRCGDDTFVDARRKSTLRGLRRGLRRCVRDGARGQVFARPGRVATSPGSRTGLLISRAGSARRRDPRLSAKRRGRLAAPVTTALAPLSPMPERTQHRPADHDQRAQHTQSVELFRLHESRASCAPESTSRSS